MLFAIIIRAAGKYKLVMLSGIARITGGSVTVLPSNIFSNDTHQILVHYDVTAVKKRLTNFSVYLRINTIMRMMV